MPSSTLCTSPVFYLNSGMVAFMLSGWSGALWATVVSPLCWCVVVKKVIGIYHQDLILMSTNSHGDLRGFRFHFFSHDLFFFYKVLFMIHFIEALTLVGERQRESEWSALWCLNCFINLSVSWQWGLFLQRTERWSLWTWAWPTGTICSASGRRWLALLKNGSSTATSPLIR